VEVETHQAAVAASLEGADDLAAELQRGGLVAGQKRNRGRPDEVGGALVAARAIIAG
jgi:hypothetical protein